MPIPAVTMGTNCPIYWTRGLNDYKKTASRHVQYIGQKQYSYFLMQYRCQWNGTEIYVTELYAVAMVTGSHIQVV